MLVSMINMNMQKIFFLKNSNITGKSEFPDSTIANNPLCLKQNQWRKALTLNLELQHILMQTRQALASHDQFKGKDWGWISIQQRNQGMRVLITI